MYLYKHKLTFKLAELTSIEINSMESTEAISMEESFEEGHHSGEYLDE